MKKLAILTSAMLLISIVSCKKERNKSATVIQDCSGTYLRVNGKDYNVCNSELLSSYKDGTEVTATFRIVEKCETIENKVVCLPNYIYESFVEVEKIK